MHAGIRTRKYADIGCYMEIGLSSRKIAFERNRNERDIAEKKMRCSVVILNWNGADMLRKFLPSVVKESEGKDIEIVVADNGSTDDSIAVSGDYPTIRIIQFDKNYGFAEGYNKALEEVDADYTILLNSDVEVTTGWLTTLLSYMDAHKDVAACQPKILSFTEKEQSGAKKFEHAGAAGGYMDKWGYPYCRGRIRDYVEEDKGQYDNVTDVFWATGACLCIRTDVYKENGGLDGSFFAHMEEIDLCWRLQCRGYRLVCVPESTVYHVGGGALAYDNPRKTYLNFRNNLLMLYKNLPDNRLHKVLAVRCLLDYVATMQYLIKCEWDNFRAVVKARWDFQHLRKAYKPLREENLQKATVPYPKTIADRSIIVDYYLRGKRK